MSTEIQELLDRVSNVKTQADYAACHAELKAWLDSGRPNLGSPVSSNGGNLCMWLEQIKLNGLSDHYATCVADALRLFKHTIAIAEKP